MKSIAKCISQLIAAGLIISTMGVGSAHAGWYLMSPSIRYANDPAGAGINVAAGESRWYTCCYVADGAPMLWDSLGSTDTATECEKAHEHFSHPPFDPLKPSPEDEAQGDPVGLGRTWKEKLKSAQRFATEDPRLKENLDEYALGIVRGASIKDNGLLRLAWKTNQKR